MPPRGRKKTTSPAKSGTLMSKRNTIVFDPFPIFIHHSSLECAPSTPGPSTSSNEALPSTPGPSTSSTEALPSTSNSASSTSGITSSVSEPAPSTSTSTPRTRSVTSRAKSLFAHTVKPINPAAISTTPRANCSSSRAKSTSPRIKSTIPRAKSISPRAILTSPRAKSRVQSSTFSMQSSPHRTHTNTPRASTSRTKTESYFDDNLMSPTYSSTPPKVTKKSEPEPKPKSPLPRSIQYMRLFQERDLGLKVDYHFPENAIGLKAGDYRKIKSFQFSNNEEILHTVYFLRPGKNSLIGAWYLQIRNMFTTGVGQLPYNTSSITPENTKYVVSRNTIVDACQIMVNPNIFVCVTSHVNKNTGEVHVAAPGPEHSNEYTVFKYCHPNQRPFWCVNSNYFSERFAIGCDEEICIYSITGIEDLRAIRDNVYSLAYNEMGTVLHLGCETGEFVMYDLRTTEYSCRMTPDNQMLDDVVLLSDENYCIVSGVSGCLSKIDLRVGKVVVTYPDHNRRSRKIPVSVNEKFNLLCSSGADDITRIWCLKSGKLLHSFTPPSTYPARSCFNPYSSRGYIYLLQDNFIHIYSMLN